MRTDFLLLHIKYIRTYKSTTLLIYIFNKNIFQQKKINKLCEQTFAIFVTFVT